MTSEHVRRIKLTDREGDVLRLAIDGLSNEEIAASLEISRRTVEAHMRTLFRKTGVARRSQLATWDQRGESEEESSGLRSPDIGDVAVASPSQQRRELEHCQQQLRRYAGLVRGLVDRQFPLFEERVELTLVVGDEDGHDLVTERRWTTPQPYLVYRILGPIIAKPDDSLIEPEDLGLLCRVNGQDTQVEIHPVRDVNDRLLMTILFQPGLRVETDWELTYRSPRLWDPLRSSGQDTLTWATATLDQRFPARPSELTLNVVFPASWTEERLTEQNNLGTIHTDRLPTGQTQLTWHHDSPHSGAYRWLLEASPST